MAFPFSLALGAIGGLATKGIEAWNKKKDQEHELKRDAALHKNDMEMMKMEVDKATRIADSKALTKTIISQDKEISVLPTLAERSGPKMTAFMAFCSIMLTVLQKSIRPILSYSLFVTSCIIIAKLHVKVGADAFNQGEMAEIYRVAILSILNMTELALSYWFTSRPTSKWNSLLKKG